MCDLRWGDGTLTAQLAELVLQGRVIDIDASQGMNEAVRPKGRNNLRFLRKDINGLDFDERFDIAFSNAT